MALARKFRLPSRSIAWVALACANGGLHVLILARSRISWPSSNDFDFERRPAYGDALDISDHDGMILDSIDHLQEIEEDYYSHDKKPESIAEINAKLFSENPGETQAHNNGRLNGKDSTRAHNNGRLKGKESAGALNNAEDRDVASAGIKRADKMENIALLVNNGDTTETDKHQKSGKLKENELSTEKENGNPSNHLLSDSRMNNDLSLSNSNSSSTNVGPGMTYLEVVYDHPEDIPDDLIAKFDAILVLGGEAPLSIAEPSVSVQRALNDSSATVLRRSNIALKQHRKAKDLPIVCLSTGEPIIGGSREGSHIVPQATISASYLINDESNIIDPEQVFVETSSLDTIGSAFYSRIIFADNNEWDNLLVVTNQLRLNYTKAVFNWIYSLDRVQGKNYNLYFLAPPDIVVDTPNQNEKAEYVQNKLAPRYQSINALWHFIAHDHALYSAKHMVEHLRTAS